MRIIRNKLIFGLMGLLFLFSGNAVAGPTPNPGELLSVSGSGSYMIEDGDIIAAREAAEAAALRNALSLLISAHMSEEEIFANEEFLEANIYTPGPEFVQSYKYIKQGISEDELNYEISVEYTFFVTYIRKALSGFGIEVREQKLPTVVVILEEQTLGGLAGASFLLLPSSTEQRLKKSISSLGYKVISRDEVRALNQNRRVQMAMSGDPLALKWLAEKFSANFLILGNASPVTYSATAGQAAYAEGRVSAKVYKGLSGRVVWDKDIVKRLEGSAGTTSIQAVRLAADRFDEEMTEFFQQEMAP